MWTREPQVVSAASAAAIRLRRSLRLSAAELSATAARLPPPPGYPSQAARPPSGIQQQDLPPPPGGIAAPPGPGTAALPGLPPGQRQPRGTPRRYAGNAGAARTTRW